jgi:hypothetical protein
VFSFKNGRFEGATGLPLLLIDGIVAGMWENKKQSRRITIRVESFRPLTPIEHSLLEQETARIGNFLNLEPVLWLGLLV